MTTAARLIDLRLAADAVICTADVVAVGVLTALQNTGRRVPDEIAVASFDGTFLTQITSPGLTSLESRVDLLARAAIELVDGVRSEDAVVAPKLIVRGSTDAVEVRAFGDRQ